MRIYTKNHEFAETRVKKISLSLSWKKAKASIRRSFLDFDLMLCLNPFISFIRLSIWMHSVWTLLSLLEVRNQIDTSVSFSDLIWNSSSSSSFFAFGCVFVLILSWFFGRRNRAGFLKDHLVVAYRESRVFSTTRVFVLFCWIWIRFVPAMYAFFGLDLDLIFLGRHLNIRFHLSFDEFGLLED